MSTSEMKQPYGGECIDPKDHMNVKKTKTVRKPFRFKIGDYVD